MRSWFEEHHSATGEVMVGFYKKSTGIPSVTWPQAVDVALCFGWIDGVRKGIDEQRYKIRFTPRRAESIWSAVNIARIPELIKADLMTPAGLAAFERRTASKSAIYSYEQKEEAVFNAAELELFRGNAKAWDYFHAQAPSYRRQMTYWISSAKREDTRTRRLALLIENSAKHIRMR